MDFVVGFDERGFLAEGATENFGVVARDGALLFPRLGDYAVLKRDGTVVLAGLFGENWEL